MVFIQHQQEGKQEHHEAMSKVPEHHGEQEGEGDDGEESCSEGRARPLTQTPHGERTGCDAAPRRGDEAARQPQRARLPSLSAPSTRTFGLPTWVHFPVAADSVGVHDVLEPLGEFVGADESRGRLFRWDDVHKRGDCGAALSLSYKRGRKMTALEPSQQIPVACHRPCVARRGSAGHRPGGSSAAGTGEAWGAAVLRREGVARLGGRRERGARNGRCMWTQAVPGAPT